MKLNMLLGAASASAQIEGGSVRHTWSRWAEQGHIRDGASPSRANDHFRLWKSDIDLMAEMGLRVYRLSVEWARLEPERGRYDPDAADFYRSLLEYIKSKGIEPLLTIHHFTNPLWFEDMGGFANSANIPVFLGFVEHVVNITGDLVSEYVTINEPNVFAVEGYYSGAFPPGETSMKRAFQVLSVMTACHIRAYELIHHLRADKGYTDTKVGFAHHARVFAPKQRFNPWHRLCSRLSARMFQTALVRACLLGRFGYPLKRLDGIKPGRYADFLGLNYYTRSTVTGLADGVRENAPTNDLGWEIYPQGIAQCARELYQVLKLPIYVTENGTCDNSDTFRSRYIYEHLKALADSGLPVERYYHWCFTDNFEWNEGESARFGLVHVDYATQTRTIKKSGRFFSAIIAQGGVTEAMFNEYVAPEQYKKP